MAGGMCGEVNQFVCARNGDSIEFSWAHVDWIALMIGTVGTLLWARNRPWAKYAALFWLGSSLIWLAYAYTTGQAALGLRDSLSILLYVYGAWRWLKPDADENGGDKDKK